MREEQEMVHSGSLAALVIRGAEEENGVTHSTEGAGI